MFKKKPVSGNWYWDNITTRPIFWRIEMETSEHNTAYISPPILTYRLISGQEAFFILFFSLYIKLTKEVDRKPCTLIYSSCKLQIVWRNNHTHPIFFCYVLHGRLLRQENFAWDFWFRDIFGFWGLPPFNHPPHYNNEVALWGGGGREGNKADWEST